MIIRQTKNGSITERKSSPFRKKIRILSEKFKDEKYSLKKNSFINEILNKKYFEKNQDNNDENKTIVPQYLTHRSKVKIMASKNITKNISDKYINNNQITKNSIFDDKVFNNDQLINVNDKQYDLPKTSRCDYNTKEKYLKKFFKNIIDSNIKNINIKYNKNKNRNETNTNNEESIRITINTHSKRNNSSTINPGWKESIIKNDNKNNISTGIITNESMINFEDELNYEFEIRLLKKKLKELKKKNKKIKNDIFVIKNEQKIKQIHENKRKKNEYIISKVIDMCKNISQSDKSNYNSYNETFNGLSSSQIISKYNLNEDSDEFPATKLFKNILLNIMDLKYESHNISLTEEFIVGIKNLLLKNENEYEYKDKNKDKEQFIYKKIKGLIKEEAKLKSKISKFKYLKLESQKYYDYFSKLCKKLCLHNLEDLDEYIKNTIIKAEEEYKQINQLKKIVMENINDDTFNKNILKEELGNIKNNNNSLKQKYNFSNYNVKNNNKYCIIDQKHFRNKNNSESKISKHLTYNIIKEEEKNNINTYSSLKDKTFNQKTLMKYNLLKNNDDSFNNRCINTYRYTGPSVKCKNINSNSLKQIKSGNINVYDFSKQKNYDYFANDYYNLENRDYINEGSYNKTVKKNKVEIPHSIKYIKIYPYEYGRNESNVKNISYNNIINFKKKELGLNNNTKNRIKLNLKEEKNRQLIKNHIKNCMSKLK